MNDKDIAIVGMSCIFPGAKDLDAYWQNILNKTCSIKEAPEKRIDPVYFNSASEDIDRLYCSKGGFIDEYVDFDPVEFGLVPNSVKGTEPEQLLALKMTVRALEDAGVFEKNISLEKSGIIIGKAGFGGVETTKVHETIYSAESLVRLLKTLAPSLSNDEIYRIKKNFQQQTGHFGKQNVMGTVPNIVASLVANRLNLNGPAYVVDAACASSIIAIDNAVRELQSHRCDLMVAGAIHLGQTPAFWTVFSLLGAFSRSQVIRPFDKKADGVLPGEGCGFVVLSRLKDAINNDQRIYAVIKGSGLSSDGSAASLMSPAWQGQLKSIVNAWESSGLSYEQIGYIEAHGTATVIGDKTEAETLQKAFGTNNKLPFAGIGSVKSMIGHTMPAAGIAGVIKAAKAVYHGILPPTLNCDEPLEALIKSRFRPVKEAVEWAQTGLPTIAGVNAFGFGGSNSHIILEKFNHNSKPRKLFGFLEQAGENDQVLLLARKSKKELIDAIQGHSPEIGDGNYRIAIFNPTQKRKELAIRVIHKEIPWRNKQDIWYTHAPLLSNSQKVAFIFPGLDGPGLASIKSGNYNRLADYFGFKTLSGFNNPDGIKLIFDLDESCRLLDSALKMLGVEPDVVAGHSVGEWTACTAVGLVNEKITQIINNRVLKKKYEKPDAVFLAINSNISDLDSLLVQFPEIYLANDNCTNQFVVCGIRSNILSLQEKLNKMQVISNLLPFETGYHTPFSKKFEPEVSYTVNNIVQFEEPQYPLWSSITAKPYPKNPNDIKQLHIDFITKPVLFRELTKNLYNEGVRVFVQIGAGSVNGFIADTLKDKDISLVSAASNKREALSQLKRVLAALFVEGKPINTSFLGLAGSSRDKKYSTKKGLNTMLDLSLPFINYNKVFDQQIIEKIAGATNAVAAPDAVLNLYKRNLNDISFAQKEILQVLKQQNSTDGKPINLNELPLERTNMCTEQEISFELFPALKDHVPFRIRSSQTTLGHEGDACVPLTMFLELFMDVFSRHYPFLVISKIINIRVLQFLWVTKKLTVSITGKWIGSESICFEIENYASATLVTGEKNGQPPAPSLHIEKNLPVQVSVQDVYDKGYMFHGRAYQGIKQIEAYSSDMLTTSVEELQGKGSLLDTIGQTIGVQSHLSGRNIRAFPVAIKEIIFYGNPFDKNGLFQCTSRFIRDDDDFIYSNAELVKEGKTWCRVNDWQVRKSEIDAKIWQMMTNAEDYYISELFMGNVTLLDSNIYQRANTWFTLKNIYLSQAENSIYNSFSTSKQKEWLIGRIAAKDSVRKLILGKYGEKIHPACINIINDTSGKPIIQTEQNNHEGISVSIAHKNGLALASSSFDTETGVDIEEIKARDTGFTDLVLSEREKTLINPFIDKDEWLTRIWAAKEAFGKSTGKGLAGSPLNYEVSSIDGNLVTIGKTSVLTTRHNSYIIGWTC
ncbi:MAG: 4'-phosphopantetheinyl transferase superfamily protein [Bacteroidales bacterium]|nr:4'-phosphopantetheinyl transferase superfamily protein [Bacteroidales bacterium]